MLVNNVGGERSAAAMVKDSKFYIDLAKFVQAYIMIVKNPNEFLSEVGEAPINAKSDMLTWQQFVKIMQGCDLGYEAVPTETDLLVMYNYALEIGSLGSKAKKLASVEDVANAQKHFYNFIDESADKAEVEFLKQQEISANRDREAKSIDSKLTAIKAKNILSIVIMSLGVFLFCYGLASLFVDNVIARAIGSIIPVWNRSSVGGIILIVVGIVMFVAVNNFYLKTKYAYLKLKDTSKPIFARSDSCFHDTLVLKNKLDVLKQTLRIVKAELEDKEQSSDVMNNLRKLFETNKFYKKFASKEQFLGAVADQPANEVQEELAAVGLSKEAHENVRSVAKEAIVLDGNGLEEEAPATAEEKAKAQKQEENETEEVYGEFVGETNSRGGIVNERETKKMQEIEKAEKEQTERLQEIQRKQLAESKGGSSQEKD